MGNNLINKNNIKVNKDEVLRYLGYKNQIIDKEMIQIIDECRELTLNVINPRCMYNKYNLDYENNEIIIKESDITLKGNDIIHLLKESKQCILCVATLGLEIERLIKLYSYKDIVRSVILDACATTAIEEVVDLIEIDIKLKLKDSKEDITWRYSPGYGDLPIETNRLILEVLKAQKNIGLTITNHNLLIPIKSVVAIMGIIDHKEIDNIDVCNNKCIKCPNYNSCSYRREV